MRSFVLGQHWHGRVVGLTLLVQETLERNPHNGQLFVIRGRRGGLIKGAVA